LRRKTKGSGNQNRRLQLLSDEGAIGNRKVAGKSREEAGGQGFETRTGGGPQLGVTTFRYNPAGKLV